MALLDDFDFGRDGIDAINDEVGALQRHLCGRFGKVENGERAHLASRVDVKNAVFHNIDFELAQSGSGGDDLAVDVGDRYRVGVDER